jgi:hypothetical protein
VSDETWKYLSDDSELSLPSVDVCAWCADVYCDGIACIAAMDPDDEGCNEAISELHSVIRAGKAFLGATEALANAGQGVRR